MKKILIVAESIDVEDSSGSKANVALIQNLKEAGYELKVYHYTRKEIKIPGIESVSIREIKTSKNYFLSRLQRKLQHGLNINLAKYLEPLFGFSFTFFNDTASITKALRSENVFNPDLVLTLSKGASYRPHYSLIALPELQEKWMAYIHDPYPFRFYPEPYNWSEPGYEQKIVFFRNVSLKCKWAGFPSLYLSGWMEEKFSAFKGKSVIIPHQITENNEQVESEYFDPDKFTVLHAGNLLIQRPPFGLIEGFNRFIKKHPEAQKSVRLVLLGSGGNYSKELAEYETRIPQLIFSQANVPYKEVRFLQKKASVNVILESKAAVSPFLPGKFPHCVEANRPILLLGPEKSESRRLLGEGYPYWCETDNVDKICEHIENLFIQWKSTPTSLRLDRKDLEEYLSYDYLRSVLNKLKS